MGWCVSGRAIRKSWRHMMRDFRAIPVFAWVSLLLCVLEGFISFAIDLNLMTFFHQKFSLSSQTSGQFFGMQGILALLLTLPGGMIMDKLGTKTTVVAGFTAATVSRLILAFSSSEAVALATLSLGVSLGSGLISLSIWISFDRIPEGSAKNMAFSLLYCSTNLGDVLASWANPKMIDIGGFNQFQFMFFCTALIALIGLVISLIFLWVPDEEHVITFDKDGEEVKRPGYCDIWREVTFWRALALALVFLPVRTMFRHLNSILPVYMQNLYGPSVDYSFAIGINPLGVIILSPLVGFITRDVTQPLPLIFLGVLICALSPIPMLLWRPAAEQWPIWLYSGLFTVGEVLYSPKVSQLAVSIPPPEQKGLYSTLIMLPSVLGTLFAGFEAGWLLQNFCPDSVTINYDYWATYSCANLWLGVMSVALITVMLLICTGRFIVGAPVRVQMLELSDE